MTSSLMTAIDTTFVIDDSSPKRRAWKRLIQAAKLCRNNGNLPGACELYKRALQMSHTEDATSDQELADYLAANLWI